MTNRRDFLKLLGVGAATVAIAPKLVFGDSVKKAIAPAPVELETALSNQLLTPSMITKEALKILEKNLKAMHTINRQFDRQFAKIGSTLRIRVPS
jgi:hypothetical protein